MSRTAVHLQVIVVDEISKQLLAAAVATERVEGLALNRKYARQGRPGRALYALVRSVERQARLAGIKGVQIHPRSLSTDVAWWERP